jgi:hypothetical protein
VLTVVQMMSLESLKRGEHPECHVPHELKVLFQIQSFFLGVYRKKNRRLVLW